MAKGEPAFHLVNVTAATDRELREQIWRLLVSYTSVTPLAKTASW